MDAGKIPGGKLEGIDPGMLDKDPFRRTQRISYLSPVEFAMNTQGLARAESPADFVRFVPTTLLQESLGKAIVIYNEYPQSFFFEVALDCGYFKGLIARTDKLWGKNVNS